MSETPTPWGGMPRRPAPRVMRPKRLERPELAIGLRLTILISTVAGASIIAAAIVISALLLRAPR